MPKHDLHDLANDILEAWMDDGARRDEDERHCKERKKTKDEPVQDLSVLLARNLPSNWPNPFLPSLIVKRLITRGPEPYVSEAILIDEHNGTHWDSPNHFIPPTSSGLPNAGPAGDVLSQDIPPSQ